ncbi:unnamed protein product [Urochloa humidicola]
MQANITILLLEDNLVDLKCEFCNAFGVMMTKQKLYYTEWLSFTGDWVTAQEWLPWPPFTCQPMGASVNEYTFKCELILLCCKHCIELPENAWTIYPVNLFTLRGTMVLICVQKWWPIILPEYIKILGNSEYQRAFTYMHVWEVPWLLSIVVCWFRDGLIVITGFHLLWQYNTSGAKLHTLPIFIILRNHDGDSVSSNTEILVDPTVLSSPYLSTELTHQFWLWTWLLQLFQYLSCKHWLWHVKTSENLYCISAVLLHHFRNRNTWLTVLSYSQRGHMSMNYSVMGRYSSVCCRTESKIIVLKFFFVTEPLLDCTHESEVLSLGSIRFQHQQAASSVVCLGGQFIAIVHCELLIQCNPCATKCGQSTLFVVIIAVVASKWISQHMQHSLTRFSSPWHFINDATTLLLIRSCSVACNEGLTTTTPILQIRSQGILLIPVQYKHYMCTSEDKLLG